MEEEQRKLAEELFFSTPRPPSFAKMFYFGFLDTPQIFPFPHVSDQEHQETRELLKNLKTLLDEKLDPVAIDRQARIPDEVIAALGKLGILGMTIPKKYGGLGMSQYAYCKAAEMIAGRCASTALFVNAHQSVGLKALLLFGSEEQKQRWLPPLASGKEAAAFALTEPNAGSDAAGIETKATYIPEKNIWVINGKKQWITNGGFATVLTVMAKTPVKTADGVKEKVTAFIVTSDMAGFRVVDPSLEKVGMRGSQTAILEFNNVEVPASNILGELGAGLKICLTVLDYGRTTFGATCTGMAKFCKEKAIEHARNRYQFKRPLASFSLVKKKIAKICSLTYAMESTTYLTAALIDQKVEDIMIESAILKVFASDSLWDILYETMQIYGGRSFFTDHPFERMMRDARLNMIGEGSNEVMRAFIGAVGMRDVGMQLKSVADGIKNPWKNYPLLKQAFLQFWHRLRQKDFPVESPFLRIEASRLNKAIKYFGFAVTKLLIRYREDIIEKQLQLDRIASCAIALYSCAAVITRIETEWIQGKRDPDFIKYDIASGKLYCNNALTMLKRTLNAIDKNLDDETEKLSDLFTGIENK